MSDVDSRVFDAIRSNKMNFFEFQEWMEERVMEGFEDGYAEGWREAEAKEGARG